MTAIVIATLVVARRDVDGLDDRDSLTAPLSRVPNWVLWLQPRFRSALGPDAAGAERASNQAETCE